MLRKYQIDAIVQETNGKVAEKADKLREKLRASFAPTREQQEVLSLFDEIITGQQQRELLEERLKTKREELENKIRKLDNPTSVCGYNWCGSDYMKGQKELFINNEVQKKLPHIPSYSEIERKLTIATVMVGFNVEEWIQSIIDSIKCGE